MFGTLGIAPAAASGATLNHVADRHIDAVMVRISQRPLPMGEVTHQALLLFPIFLAWTPPS